MRTHLVTRQMQNLQQAGAGITRIRELLNITGKIPEKTHTLIEQF